MQIFNISNLFKTPDVAGSVKTNLSISKVKRRRRRGQARVLDYHASGTKSPSVPKINQNIERKRENVNKKRSSVGNVNKIENARKRKIKNWKRKHNPIGDVVDRKTPPYQSIDFRGETTKSTCHKFVQTETKIFRNTQTVIETNPIEVTDLLISLRALTSEKDVLEKNLHELREENGRLARNNEDLKEELKEMTDEALEFSLEKERLSSKIELLKKQLLNRPK